MNLRTLALRGVTFHWRNHLGVVLGVILGSAILCGALVVGDSVRYTLKSIAFSRIGETDLALPAGDRLFPIDLADRISKDLGPEVVPTLMLRGAIRRGDDDRYANRVKILGVRKDFWKLSKEPFDFDPSLEDAVYVNQHLADYLSLKEGDEVLIRV
ncbi:MAG: hypothetical protein KC940_09165, partial [Candidatus Omnitrophica bacterium]|nr:hypothetical protein [Candidatus Omnitrophota bacterium]